MQVNSMLREQLEQANVANAALSEDIRKLTADWARARDELEQREAEWRREEEVGGGHTRDVGTHQGCGREQDGGWWGEGCGDVALGSDVGRDAGSLGGMQGHGRRYMEENLGVQGNVACDGRVLRGRGTQGCGTERDVGPAGKDAGPPGGM